MTDSYRETLLDHDLVARYRAIGLNASGSGGASTRAWLLAVVLVLSAVAFYALAIAVLSGSSTHFDDAALRYLHQHAYPNLQHFANLVSMLVTAASVLVLVYLCWHRQWQAALFWFGSTAGASILAGIAKKLVQRHRPELWALASRHASFSFPSGHATQAMAFILALLLLSPPQKYKTIFALGLAWICLVGLCRLYLGLHYPSDIFAGWALALAWCCLLGLLARLPRNRNSAFSESTFLS